MKIGLYKLESPNVASDEIEKYNDELINKIIAAGAGVDVCEVAGASVDVCEVAGAGVDVCEVAGASAPGNKVGVAGVPGNKVGVAGVPGNKVGVAGVPNNKVTGAGVSGSEADDKADNKTTSTTDNEQITLINDNEIEAYNTLFVFVGGGGTETQFKKTIRNYRGKIYLIATTINNSLAASMEILSFLHNKNVRSEIIHGDTDTIIKRVKDIVTVQRTITYLRAAKFARIGKPSDWLIASDVNADWLQNKMGTKIIDISIKEFVREIKRNKYEDDEYTTKFKTLKFDEQEKEKALCVYGALKRLVAKYELSGLTVRCFDLLDTVHTTSCAALALLNAQGIHSSCEGDVPSLLSMAIINELTGQPAFQANPSVIDTKENTIVLAHCTLPLNMSDNVKLDTHFESGIGIALKSKISTGNATIFKTSGLLDRHFVSAATIVKNLNKPELCRTQILVRPEKSVSYFLKESIGNHHIIVNGDYSQIIEDFFASLK